MLRAIRTFIKDPAPTGKLEEVVAGRNVVEGIVRVEEPLRSPVRGQHCAAFFYRSFLLITEGRAPAIHKLKEVEVYGPFDLLMEGGALAVIPVKPGSFDQAAHRELARTYPKGFQATEEVVLPGARVRLRGKVRIIEGKPVLHMSNIAVLDRQAEKIGVVADRKSRRKKK